MEILNHGTENKRVGKISQNKKYFMMDVGIDVLKHMGHEDGINRGINGVLDRGLDANIPE